MKRSTKILIGTIILTIYLAIVIGIENLFRDPLFKISLKLIQDWQHDSTNSEYILFRVFHYFGNYAVYLPMTVIIFFSQPLNKSFTFLCVLLYSTFFSHFLQLAYSDPRPFWVNPNLLRYPCSVSFANPSGHAITSLPIYLSFWHIMTDYKFFHKYKSIRFLLLILVIGIVFTIYLSRIYLAAHGINQVIYGCLLGIVFYVVFFHIIKLQTYTAEEFFRAMCGPGLELGPTILLVNTFLLFVLIMLYYYREISIDRVYLFNALQACPGKKWYQYFRFASMVNGLGVIMGFIGIISGLAFVSSIADRDYRQKICEINDWYKGIFVNHVLRYLLFIPFCLPVLLIALIPPNVSFPIFYIFKISLPAILLGFLIFGVYIISCIKLKIANGEIYKNRIEYEVVPPPVLTIYVQN